MVGAIKIPADDADVRELPAIVAAIARFLNALRNNSVTTSKDSTTGLDVSESNAVLKLPPGGSGGGGGAGGQVVFAGTASGELAYFLVSASATSYSSPPPGYTLVNPP